MVTISSFDPVRREIAKVALQKLIVDGRIHPGRIEEIANKAKSDVEATIYSEGEQAAYKVGMSGLNPELIKILGRLNSYRAVASLVGSALIFLTLDRLGYDTVLSKQDDGYWGWEEHAPFDAIIVTAAPDHVPQPLLNQLADGGRMVIPVGPPGGYQSLWFITREGDEFKNYNWGGVRFVPFTRDSE